jgi:site-specific DNA recombinase
MRAAIYARYSSDKQSETSADDQARMCLEHAEREGWAVVDIFKDEAVSGAVRDRPGLSRLLARAAEFDIMLAESIDRISRDQEDIAGIHKRLRFAGVDIVTLQDGAVGEIHIGLKGTMAALFLRDLAQKTRRGQIGRVAAGRIPGGLSYGYAKVIALDARGEPERGLRTIVEAEAEVVRRIFRQYLAGASPREMAKVLNAEGIPGPRGGLWRANTINGSRQRRNGILNNELYVGRIVYNRQAFIKDPDTRRRVSRPNPRSEWKTQDVDELRIVDQPVWAAVQARLERGAARPARQRRRPTRLFSGLLKCGECGGTVTIITGDRWGCSNRKETGTCSNNRVTSNSVIEKRVLGAMREQLMDPELVSAYVREYHLAATRKMAEFDTGKKDLQARRKEADASVKRLAIAIADGSMALADIKPLLIEAQARRDACDAALAEIEAGRVIPLHPTIAVRYRESIDHLVAALEGPGERRAEAKMALRGLIERIDVYARQACPGVDLEVNGRLAEIIRFAQNKKAPAEAGADCTFQVVAGVGFEPTTFRL